MHEHVQSLSYVRFFATSWTVAHQAPLSMEFSRQEYWSGLPFPSPGDLPDPGSSCLLLGRQIFYHWATREAPLRPICLYKTVYLIWTSTVKPLIFFLFIFSLPLPGSTAGCLVNTALLTPSHCSFFSVFRSLSSIGLFHLYPQHSALKRLTSPSHERPIRELLCFWVSASTANQRAAFLLHCSGQPQLIGCEFQSLASLLKSGLHRVTTLSQIPRTLVLALKFLHPGKLPRPQQMEWLISLILKPVHDFFVPKSWFLRPFKVQVHLSNLRVEVASYQMT